MSSSSTAKGREFRLWILLLTAGGVLTTPDVGRSQSYCGPVTIINFNGTNGQYPIAGVTFDEHGTMYGTTGQGGPSYNPQGNAGILNNGLGTIWKYTPAAGLTTLFAFSGETSPANNGYKPDALTIDAAGNLYGTTYEGGNGFAPNQSAFGLGTIFKYSASGQFSLLYEFSGPEGANPIGRVILDSQGHLWGTTWEGGIGWNPALGNFGLGTVFEYSSGSLMNPVQFQGSNGGGNISGGMASDGDGNFYGTTYEGGANGFGTIFRYNSISGQLTTLLNFNRTNGSLPLADVTLDGNGNLFGTTYQGGSHSSASNNCCGTVWKYSLASGVLTTLVNFDGDNVPADGMFPWGGVTLDSKGNLYGITTYGGTYGDGIVYEYSSAGELSTLATFSGPNGSNPEGNLALDSAGNLYGTTNQGGTFGSGTVYEMTLNTSEGACGGIALSSLTLSPISVPNGQSSTGTITLSAAAPSGGATVTLSSNSTFAIVPPSVFIAAGATTATFTVAANNGFVLSDTPVTITASLGNSTLQATMTITPGIAISSITVSPNNVTAGSAASGTVTIASPAPAGGNAVFLALSPFASCNLPVNFPTNPVMIAAGRTSATFTVITTSTTVSCTAPVFAQSGGATVSANFTVKPGGSSGNVTLSSISFNPSNVTGGSNATGTVTLNAAASSQGAVLTLTSSNPSIAAVPATLTVLAGHNSATFNVNTQPVSSDTNVTVTANYGGVNKSGTLTVKRR
jgi:uncharacterized repeat protein (TIGR03803 family)